MNKKMLALVLAALMSVSTTVVAFAEPVADSAVSSTESGEVVAPEAGETVKNPEELKKAVEKSGTVKLGANITASIEIPAEAEVTLDLNGCMLTNEASKHTITNKGTLTIIDSSAEKDGVVDNVSHVKAALFNDIKGVAILNGGKFTRSHEKGTYEPYQGNGNSWYTITNYGNMTIEDGVVVNTKGGFSSLILNGNCSVPATLTINGGSFSGGVNCVKNDELGELVINNGSFNNEQVTVMNWNHATINGGTFVSTESHALSNGAWKNEKGEITGAGNLTINGGTYASAENKVILGTGEGGTGEQMTKVNGGVFESPLCSQETLKNNVHLGNGVKFEVDESGNVVITEAEERVERDNGGDYFGNEKWAKVKREIAAAEEGDTIKVSATGLPWFPSSVARALKGHDITLEIRKNGTTYSVNGEKIGAIEKIWYEFDQLEEKLLTAEAK
mgnify:FL=1